MSSFSESALEKKLTELSSSQQSVQTLSLWIIHHRKHSGLIVKVWHRELKKGETGTHTAAYISVALGTLLVNFEVDGSFGCRDLQGCDLLTKGFVN